MLDQLEDAAADPPYLVPTHLREPQSIGPIPVRTFYVLLGAGLLLGAPVAVLGRRELGDGGLWLGLVPLLLVVPFALPWLDPPAEHGTLRLLAFLATTVARNLTWTQLPPWAELREADGLLPFLRVLNAYRRRCVLGLDEQPELAGLEVADGVVYVPVGRRRREPRAIYRVPTLNLDTASASARRSARAKWGAILNALPHPIQIVVRATPATTLPILERIKAHGSPQASTLAAWLGAHLHGAELVQRRRYLVVPAEDLETLGDRCASLEASLRRIGLPLERVQATDQLRAVLGAFLTPRPHAGRIGPALTDVSSSGHLLADGELVRAFDVGKLPPTIVTDWAAPLLDGDLPLDVAIDVQPLDLAWAKLQLDTRRNALESSNLTPGRQVALEQIAGLRMAYERRQTLPMRMAITVVVRAPDQATLKRRTKRLRQRAKDLGAELRLLRWEQRAGWLAVAPLRYALLPRRGLPVETGTVARTYPWSAGTLVLEGGVPFGVAASSPVTFTVAQPRRAGRKGWRHMVWHGATGSGKSYQLRVYLSREHFANGVRVYVIDQDEQQEYAGRFCAYLQGSRVQICTPADAEAFAFDQVPNPDVVVWDLHESDEAERGAIFATLKAKLCAYQLAGVRRRCALVIDEALTVTEDEQGRRALGDLARRGRHFGVELHTLTQRLTDWLDTGIGRAIQSNAANQWLGQMEDRELREVVEHGTDLSLEEQERIRRAGQGEGLLLTAGRRVWVTLYGHTSPDEFAAFNTDRDEDTDDGDELAEDRRNGHAAPLTALAAR
jgi:hypothetical protein